MGVFFDDVRRALTSVNGKPIDTISIDGIIVAEHPVIDYHAGDGTVVEGNRKVDHLDPRVFLKQGWVGSDVRVHWYGDGFTDHKETVREGDRGNTNGIYYPRLNTAQVGNHRVLYCKITTDYGEVIEQLNFVIKPRVQITHSLVLKNFVDRGYLPNLDTGIPDFGYQYDTSAAKDSFPGSRSTDNKVGGKYIRLIGIDLDKRHQCFFALEESAKGRSLKVSWQKGLEVKSVTGVLKDALVWSDWDWRGPRTGYGFMLNNVELWTKLKTEPTVELRIELL